MSWKIYAVKINGRAYKVRARTENDAKERALAVARWRNVKNPRVSGVRDVTRSEMMASAAYSARLGLVRDWRGALTDEQLRLTAKGRRDGA